jgi:hypothetical protein
MNLPSNRFGYMFASLMPDRRAGAILNQHAINLSLDVAFVWRVFGYVWVQIPKWSAGVVVENPLRRSVLRNQTRTGGDLLAVGLVGDATQQLQFPASDSFQTKLNLECEAQARPGP